MTDINLGVLSCLEHITLSSRIRSFPQIGLSDEDVIQRAYYPLPAIQLERILKTLATCKSHNSIKKIRLVISVLHLEDLGPCDWFSLDSLFECPGTWNVLNEVSLFALQHGTNIHEVLSEHGLEQVEYIELPCLKGRGVAVNWHQYAPW